MAFVEQDVVVSSALIDCGSKDFVIAASIVVVDPLLALAATAASIRGGKQGLVRVLRILGELASGRIRLTALIGIGCGDRVVGSQRAVAHLMVLLSLPL